MARRGTTPALCAHYSANPYYREYGAIGGYTIPLLAGAIRRGERVAIAIEARGVGPGMCEHTTGIPLCGRADIVEAFALVGVNTLILVVS